MSHLDLGGKIVIVRFAFTNPDLIPKYLPQREEKYVQEDEPSGLKVFDHIQEVDVSPLLVDLITARRLTHAEWFRWSRKGKAPKYIVFLVFSEHGEDIDLSQETLWGIGDLFDGATWSFTGWHNPNETIGLNLYYRKPGGIPRRELSLLSSRFVQIDE